jgi:hypothetical protein
MQQIQDKETPENVANIIVELERIREELLSIQMRLQKFDPSHPIGKYDGEK